MFRNYKRKALYEVINRDKAKFRYDKTLEPVHPEQAVKSDPPAPEAPKQHSVYTRWQLKPKSLQFNTGKIEISIPYPVGIAVVLGLILVVLIAYRLGQITSVSSPKTASPPATATKVQKPAAKPVVAAPQAPAPAVKVTPAPAAPVKTEEQAAPPVAATSAGNNRIVIQTCQRKADLEPVKEYFAQSGIETEIRTIGNWYYLVTTNKYENPERPGTDGYAARQKIIEVGAGYKAPPGYGSFGEKPFSDAYGMKFDD